MGNLVYAERGWAGAATDLPDQPTVGCTCRHWTGRICKTKKGTIRKIITLKNPLNSKTPKKYRFNPECFTYSGFERHLRGTDIYPNAIGGQGNSQEIPHTSYPSRRLSLDTTGEAQRFARHLVSDLRQQTRGLQEEMIEKDQRLPYHAGGLPGYILFCHRGHAPFPG